MTKMAHRISLALGFAVACLHAICGADRAELRDCTRSSDTFLSGVIQASEQLARIDEPRKLRNSKRSLRDSKVREVGLSETAAFIISEFARINVDVFEPQKFALEIGAQNKKFVSVPTERALFCIRVAERSNPIRAPSAA